MGWSREQTEAHEASFDKFRAAYIAGENKTASLEDIANCRKRCVTLIRLMSLDPRINSELEAFSRQTREFSSESYLQEIPHFTIDCHRYLTEDKLPENINQLALEEQQKLVITPEEFSIYDKILSEQIGKEKFFPAELRGVAFGGDGLVAQVWYDNQRLHGFNDKLGERVRKEVPSMDFIWGMVKGKVPYRVLNITRFTGKENKEQVLSFVDKNRDKRFGEFNISELNLCFADHYVQKKNFYVFGEYSFSH